MKMIHCMWCSKPFDSDATSSQCIHCGRQQPTSPLIRGLLPDPEWGGFFATRKGKLYYMAGMLIVSTALAGFILHKVGFFQTEKEKWDAYVEKRQNDIKREYKKSLENGF